jgi:hypothetical protein
MAQAPGIDGEREPEAECVYLCEDNEVERFRTIDAGVAPDSTPQIAKAPAVDVWEVDVTGLPVEDGKKPSVAAAWYVVGHPIARARLRLVRADVPTGSPVCSRSSH